MSSFPPRFFRVSSHCDLFATRGVAVSLLIRFDFFSEVDSYVASLFSEAQFDSTPSNVSSVVRSIQRHPESQTISSFVNSSSLFGAGCRIGRTRAWLSEGNACRAILRQSDGPERHPLACRSPHARALRMKEGNA
jgi:hypothetical protein